jgi:hypothetical protein
VHEVAAGGMIEVAPVPAMVNPGVAGKEVALEVP